jgi:hypothetical protein
MTLIGQPERATQDRVIALLRDELGYRYLGDWRDRDGNSNVEEGLLSAWLSRRGHPPERSAPRCASSAASWTSTAARSTATTRRSTTCCATARR